MEKGRYCIVDMTSSDEIGVISRVFGEACISRTPNKKCNSGPTARDQKRKGQFYELVHGELVLQATIGWFTNHIDFRNLTSSVTRCTNQRRF